MSQANELLNGLSEEEIATYAMNPEGEEHIVIDEYRNVIVPESLKRIAVQYDHNIETVTFDCPRYWDGHDLSTMVVYINYMRPDNKLGSALAENVVVDDVDDTLMHFDWTLSNNATAASGNLSFLVCIRSVDEDGLEHEHWNSELSSDLYISRGLEGAEVLVDTDPDILTQTLVLYRAVTTRAGVYVGSGIMPEGYNVQIDPNGSEITDPTGGESGATFFPSVSQDGVISWTNNKGLQNPEPVDIKGPPGAPGDPGPAYSLTEADKASIAAAVKSSLTSEQWTFTLENGSTVTKEVYLK